MFKKFKKSFAVALGLFILFSSSAYIIDSYCNSELLALVERNQEDCFARKRPNPSEWHPDFLVAYCLVWRILDNVFPAISEILCPTPKMGHVVTAKQVLEIEYYYDAWAGKIIQISSD